MSKPRSLALHTLALAGLLLAAAVLATLRGALWPFDLRATALMTAAGLAGVISGWGPFWALPLALSAALGRVWQRLLLWPLALAGMVALHAALGPARGFAPLSALHPVGAVALYAVPCGLAVLLGSALRTGLARRRTGRKA